MKYILIATALLVAGIVPSQARWVFVGHYEWRAPRERAAPKLSVNERLCQAEATSWVMNKGGHDVWSAMLHRNIADLRCEKRWRKR